MTPSTLTIALAGNPNAGKTTIFNNITGTHQKVGNWPGVTVEKKEGSIDRLGRRLRIIDLPGTYSLTPFSIEEIVARNFVLEERPDVVINIIDASNLERSLYLATQMREIDCRVVFALNMADLAKARGLKIDGRKLSQLLDVPVVFTVGNRNEGIEALLEAAMQVAEQGQVCPPERRVKYSRDIEKAVARLQEPIDRLGTDIFHYNPRWTAIKLLEDDRIVKERLGDLPTPTGPEILDLAQGLRHQLMDRYDEDPEIVMTDERYGFIAGIIKEVQTASTRRRVDISRNVDLVLTNRFVGFPIFVLFIWTMFQLTFTLGSYPMEAIDAGISWLSMGLDRLLPASLFKSLLLDGIVAGVGSVIIFLPNILILFFCIALFEDTGYMARAAFLMDKIMHLIGLHGKSFIPMLMGFGCSVPAVMAARTLESEKDRLLTILITPFMSCSARLPVYIVLAGTFFGGRAGTMIFAVYLLGIVMAVLTGRVLRSTLFRGADAPFVMELPPYRVPMLKSLLIHMWDRSKMFLRKMSGIILIGSIVVWALAAYPRHPVFSTDYDAQARRVEAAYTQRMTGAEGERKAALEAERDLLLDKIEHRRRAEQMEKSLMGRLGRATEVVFAPLGIDWRGGVALITGFVAKEIVVSTMGVLYSVDRENKSEALPNALRESGMTALAAVAMMVFVLLYVPCLATVATIRKESGSILWTAFSIVYSTALAWIVAVVIFQGGRLLGLE
jgi:ferrous iron transport protein B